MVENDENAKKRGILRRVGRRRASVGEGRGGVRSDAVSEAAKPDAERVEPAASVAQQTQLGSVPDAPLAPAPMAEPVGGQTGAPASQATLEVPTVSMAPGVGPAFIGASEPPAPAPQTGGVASASRALLFQAPDLPTWVPPRSSQQAPLAAPADDSAEAAATSRRRTRRRSGEPAREGDDAPNTVVRVRQPRQVPAPITEPQRVNGSTRLEAKKQRRRDGREAGRRRPVVTEAEFMARREAVDRVMVVRETETRTQIGVLEDGVLVEHYVARAAEASLIGNVYLGKVQNVLPSMEAAFVDIGRGRNAVLYSGEVDWAAIQADPERKNQPRRIELALRPGDTVLVQVTKDPVGHKGARLTSQVSLPGRYLVYVPGGAMNGISRKLPDTERARLKSILKEALPDSAGVIVRTAAEGATEEQLTLDVQRLTMQWAEIERAVEIGQAPALLHSEPDLLIKIVRDVFNEDFQRLVVAGDQSFETLRGYVEQVAPDLVERVERFEEPVDAFEYFRVSEQIEKALDRKVWLPSGGSLVIDRTEAMTVIDVNTGKFVGSGGNLEETVTKNNLEAAEEIVRQLRLRDIGGIIVVDFIDMVLEQNRDLVLRRLIECLSRDRTKHQVAEVTSLGLVQMTRKKLGLGLLETFSDACEVCAGRGVVVFHEPVSKHRSGAQLTDQGGQSGSGRQRRGRGGSGGQQQKVQSPPAPTTHAITADVTNALAQIAKSTVHHESAEAPAAASAPVALAVLEPAQRGRQAASPESAADAPASSSPDQVDTVALLGTALDALPASPPKGRSRRRAGSAGSVVRPPSAD